MKTARVTCVEGHVAAIKQQVNANAAAVKHTETGVKLLLANIKKQEAENATAVRAIEKGTAEVVAGIKEMQNRVTTAVKHIQADIHALQKETNSFIHHFYYGSGK